MVTGIHIGKQWQDNPRELLLRPFDGSPEDYTALAAVRNDTLRAVSLPEDFAEADGEDMARFYNRSGFSLLDNCWLMFLAGEPVAAAVLFPRVIFHDRPPGNFDMYVAPRYWRHGLGSRLLAHLEQAAMGRGYPVLETTIAKEDAQSTAFLSRHGFAVVGQYMHLTRYDMDGLSPVTLPDGYAIRSLAELGETPELYADTANRFGSYDSGYSLIRPEDLQSTVEGERWEPDGVLFSFDLAGRIVGVIRASGSRSRRGYLHEIRLEPASRGIGLGRAMLSAALHYLAAKGVQSADLDTSGEQAAAHGLALRAGFQVTRHWLQFLKRLHSDG
jgi:GNAT superfamily N-acetyltransferase